MSQTDPATPAQSQSNDDDQEQSFADLAVLGIKVRDFAYESTLPPVRPWRPRFLGLRQPSSLSQPPTSGTSRRPLKRTRADGTEVEDLGYGFVMGVARAAPPRKLQRTETGFGPELSSQDEAALRAATWDAFGSSQSQSQSQGYLQQSQGYSQQSYSNESSQANSQDTDNDEPMIKTPLVTPNGSMHWPDDDAPPLVPTEPASLETSTARVGSRPRSPPPQLKLTTDAAPPSSPPPLPPSAMDALPSSPSPPRTLLRTFSSLSTLSSPLSEPPASATGSMVIPAPPAPSPAPRYELRKRVAPPSPASPSRRRNAGPRATPRREGSLVAIHS